ncbi:MAG: hypothetical protein JXL84_13175 [Deltaproteobacteria bacterium]|nr:hypothetical protein [Deltaproteobacteria bacterium]
MGSEIMRKRLEAALISGLQRLPCVPFYAGTRGWYFIVSWCHRLSGILLVLLALFHIYTLESIPETGRSFLLMFFQWALSIPVIFHAFNGARIIRYECYGGREDEKMLRWVFSLLCVFVLLLAVLMVLGRHRVSPFFYWMLMGPAALVSGYTLGARIWNKGHSLFWKLQRISGAFLLVMIPAYMLFLQIQPSLNVEANVVVRGIQSFSIRAIYSLLLLAVLLHGGYGAWSVANDYLSSRNQGRVLAVGIACLFLFFLWIGLRMILRI